MLLTAATLMYKPFLPVLIRNGWESFRDTFHQLKLFTVIMDKIFTYFSYTGNRLPSRQVASETELDYYHQRIYDLPLDLGL